MPWTSDYSLIKCFVTHDFAIVNGKNQVIIHIPSYRETITNNGYGFLLSFFRDNKIGQFKDMLQIETNTGALTALLCEPKITSIKEFAPISNILRNALKLILPQISLENRQVSFNGVALDDELLEYIGVVYQNALGVKAEVMPKFANERAKELYIKAQACKRKSQDIKDKDKKTEPLHALSLIAYRFAYTFEQLLDMTFGQINYLQDIASKMIRYENGMSAYIAGAKTPPEFFLK